MISRPRIGLLCAFAVAAAALFATTGSAVAADTIEGEVVDAVTKVGIEEVGVCALNPAGGTIVACVESGADGEYAISLPEGSYLVEFWAPYLGYVTQFYNGVSKLSEAEEVPLSGGSFPGVDAEMEEGGNIEGRVTDALTGSGIGGIQACALVFGVGAECGITDLSGHYKIPGLATGSYLTAFLDEIHGYEPLFYNQQSGPGSANPVEVTAPDTTVGIDARLSKPASRVIVRPVSSSPPVLPISKSAGKPKPKAVKCRKSFKKVKRHGRSVCVKKHRKKKHRS